MSSLVTASNQIGIEETASAGEAMAWRYFRVIGKYARDDLDGELAWLRASWVAVGDGKNNKNMNTTNNFVEFTGTVGSLPISLVEWLPPHYHVYRIPKHYFLSQSPLHKDGQIVGMDAASVASIVALGVGRGDTVLDMCCCPGMKLKLISELSGDSVSPSPAAATPCFSQKGMTVGVDIAIQRLFVARSLMTRLDARHLILAHCDGTVFDPDALTRDIAQRRTPAKQKVCLQRLAKLQTRPAASFNISPSSLPETAQRCDLQPNVPTVKGVTSVWCSEDYQQLINTTAHKRLREESAADDWEEKHFSLAAPPIVVPSRFDRVLVDAECTHDGSLHHIVTADTATSECDGKVQPPPTFQDSLQKYKPNYSLHTEEGDSNLHTLQFKLLERGYQLLRSGGVLVYSTCSFSEGQNEAIVRKFLQTYGGDGTVEEEVVKADGEKQVTKTIKTKACLMPPFGDLSTSQEYVRNINAIADPGVGGYGIRMNPTKTNSSFQYVAKFMKMVVE